jgi:rhodanese-related sulfurtransferase
MAQDFMEKGYVKVFALTGGWDAWIRAGYPVERKGKR